MISGRPTPQPDATNVHLPRNPAAGIRRRTLIAICGTMFVATIFGSVWVASIVNGRIPELTRTDFDAALERWNSQSPSDYSIETTVVGMQPATYKVWVSDDEIVSATRNGFPLKDQRTLGTWSVLGMFRTIEHDLLATESTEEPATSSASKIGLHLRTEFDPTWGFPRRYLRVEWGTNAQVSWTVDQFFDEVTASPTTGTPLPND